MTASKSDTRKNKSGFTLVEIMVVVTLIGLLAAIAIPAFNQSRQKAVAARTANDFRKFTTHFNQYNLKNGVWPADGYPATIPSGMEEFLSTGSWALGTPIGGNWDYDFQAFGFTSGVSIHNTTADDETLSAIDALIDDGDLTTGTLIKTGGNRLSYILEQ